MKIEDNIANIIKAFLKWIAETKKDDGDTPYLHWDTQYYPWEVDDEDIDKWAEEFKVLLARGDINLEVGEE